MNQRRWFEKIPLRVVFSVPFVLLLVLTVLVVSGISFQNSRRAVNDVVGRLRNEITARISQHLSGFLATPHQINANNAYAMRRGGLDPTDPDKLAHHFWQQVHIFDSVTSIYFGNPQGGLALGGREGPEDLYYVITTEDFARGTFHKRLTDAEGNPGELMTAIPDFDARERPWYTGALAAAGPTWSDIYVLFTGQDMALPASRPVYDLEGNLLGVVSIDIFLSHLSDFLQSLEVGKTGQSFIIERSGLLVAASTGEIPLIEINGVDARISAADSGDLLTREAALFLHNAFGDYQHIDAGEKLTFELEGARHFIQATPYRDDYGIDWLIVVVIPEADFMAQVESDNRVTLLLVMLSLLISVALGVITSDWVAQPVLRLNASAQALAQGTWKTPQEPTTWIAEIHQLTVSFNDMALRLQETLSDLKAEIIAREYIQHERERLLEQVRGQARKTRQIMDTVPVGVFLLDADRRVLLANPLAEDHLKILVPGDVDAPLTHLGGCALEDLLAASDATPARELKAGSRVFEATARPVVEDTATGEWVVVINDVSEQRVAERQQQQQARLAAVGQLATGIAHDFNNIMTAILLYAQITARMPDLAPRVRERVDIIAQQARHASNLIQQILDFSRRSVLERRTLDLLPLLKEQVKLVERTFPENIQIAFEYESRSYAINADPTRIQQMVMNLAINARNAMPDGGELHFDLARINVGPEGISIPRLSDVKAGAWVRLTLTDTGSGISPDVLPRIFEPFFTTRAPLGSGLGLAQVHGIVAQHEGHIDVITAVGQGTSFVVYLPAVATETLPQLPLSASDLDALPQGQGETILVVEDEDAVIETLRASLISLGYQVVKARDGKTALRILDARSPEIALILSDVVMPQMGGEALFERVCQRYPTLPMLLISGHMMEDQLKALRSRGLRGWLLKPPDLEQLAQLVARVLADESAT